MKLRQSIRSYASIGWQYIIRGRFRQSLKSSHILVDYYNSIRKYGGTQTPQQTQLSFNRSKDTLVRIALHLFIKYHHHPIVPTAICVKTIEHANLHLQNSEINKVSLLKNSLFFIPNEEIVTVSFSMLAHFKMCSECDCIIPVAATYYPITVIYSCSYLADKIYCYGSFGAFDMIALNVQNLEPINVEILSNNWEYVSATNNIAPGNIIMPEMFTIPDRNQMYVHGGNNQSFEAATTHPFFMFDAVNNTWTTLDAYNDIFENSTIRSECIELKGKRGYFPFGFFNITVFDPVTREWLGITNATNQDKEYFYAQQFSIYHPDSDSVYYLGDCLSDYNWSTLLCLGEIPSVRHTQSFTLLPDGKTVLMLGGSYTEDDALEDSCYLLDLGTFTWSVCNWDVPSSVKTARFMHSAVLVENNLFVLFGRETRDDMLNDMFIIDVSDTNNLKYAHEYAYKLQVKATKNTSLSVGATVDIVIGSVFAACLIVGVFVYRHRKGKKAESIHDFPADWDVIDQSFNNATFTQKPATLDGILPKVKPSES
ncbi:hypothetical protein BDB01DRAFT_835607 [Pilobolus umbonatus]|nr:hypothetical protein BDB01DRAFT_835607 [Pilobolus umbonatus]